MSRRGTDTSNKIKRTIVTDDRAPLLDISGERDVPFPYKQLGVLGKLYKTKLDRKLT